jgi:hypothetical protein
MGFVPSDFEVPELLEHERFRVRPLTRVVYPGRDG